MSHWWSSHAEDFKAFSLSDKERVEDLTGCIPLLVSQFLGYSGQTLDSLEPKIWDNEILAPVATNTIDYAGAIKGENLGM
jgi:hypothetical protein